MIVQVPACAEWTDDICRVGWLFLDWLVLTHPALHSSTRQYIFYSAVWWYNNTISNTCMLSSETFTVIPSPWNSLILINWKMHLCPLVPTSSVTLTITTKHFETAELLKVFFHIHLPRLLAPCKLILQSSCWWSKLTWHLSELTWD